jgi:hypothetical protein
MSSAPTTDIEIMSDAVVLLGGKSLQTIDDANEFAVSLQKFYDLLVSSELAKNMWKFATKIEDLSQVAGFNPDFYWYNVAYDIPADFLSLVRIYPDIPYQIFGRRIYCGSTGRLQMVYNWNAPVSYWSDPFKEYMVYALAAKLAPSVAQNAQLTQIMMMERDRAHAIAMYVDSQNSPSVPIQSVPWIETRMNGIWPWGTGGGTFNGWGG